MSVQQSSSLRLSNSEALNLSQQVGKYLQTSLSSNTPIPIPFLLSAESPQSWHTYERLLISCLRTGNDKAAHQCLEKLIERFGASNERVMGLRGLYQEAVAQDRPTLETILTKYDEVLAEDPGNTVCCSSFSLLVLFALATWPETDPPTARNDLANIQTTHRTPMQPLTDKRCYRSPRCSVRSIAHRH